MTDRPIRILHVVGGMNRGGVETWLMHVLRHINRDRFQMDFLVHTDQPCAYDDEIRALGGRIIPCLYPGRPWRYGPRFLRVLREQGPYDVVHSHVHHFSGVPLSLARLVGVPVRIAHSHNDTAALDRRAAIWRTLYLGTMELLIRHTATRGIACSAEAAVALYGARWQTSQRSNLLYYGIDLASFRVNGMHGQRLREGLGISHDASVVGHVGRFAPQKNHALLVEIFAEVARREPHTHLFLVGDGPLRPAIEAKVHSLGLADKVTFAGLRSDVPQLMLNAMDLFLMPSRWEGLPVTLLEAQAAGLPCVISDVIAQETDKIPELMHRLSLDAPPAVWADEILALCAQPRPLTQPEALVRIEQSPFNIRESVRRLGQIYGG